MTAELLKIIGAEYIRDLRTNGLTRHNDFT